MPLDLITIIRKLRGGEGDKELVVGRDRATGKPLIKIDPVYYRPTEVDILMGNPAKAKLGWATKVKLMN